RCCAAKQRDQRAPPHSITSSAIAAEGRGQLARACPRVFWLGRLIGNFLERVLVCVFLILFFLLLRGYLLVAFFPQLAVATVPPHQIQILGICGHREYRDYRCDREGSHS